MRRRPLRAAPNTVTCWLVPTRERKDLFIHIYRRHRWGLTFTKSFPVPSERHLFRELEKAREWCQRQGFQLIKMDPKPLNLAE